MRYISINLLDPREAQTVVVCEDCGTLVYDTIAHDADHGARVPVPIPDPDPSELVVKITEPVIPTPPAPQAKPRAAKVVET